jgi:hypothetical protein
MCEDTRRTAQGASTCNIAWAIFSFRSFLEINVIFSAVGGHGTKASDEDAESVS